MKRITIGIIVALPLAFVFINHNDREISAESDDVTQLQKNTSQASAPSNTVFSRIDTTSAADPFAHTDKEIYTEFKDGIDYGVKTHKYKDGECTTVHHETVIEGEKFSSPI